MRKKSIMLGLLEKKIQNWLKVTPFYPENFRTGFEQCSQANAIKRCLISCISLLEHVET
jgi:hypothetical protein